jgi:uncharacterized cupin superfamily protein
VAFAISTTYGPRLAFAISTTSSSAYGKRLRYAALMSAQIVSLASPMESEVSTPAEDRLLGGTPRHSVANYFADATNQFFAGRWSSTEGSWRVRYTESELCVIVSGKVIIKSEDGASHTFGPGDAFVIPSGFQGVWTVLEPCTKIYAIFESRTG